MENIATKEDGSILTPEEFNQIPEEIENAILSSGQILSEGDTSQLAKTIVAYAGAGSSYDVGGTANNLVLTPHNDFIPPIKYYQNLIINFIPKLANTDTVNISISGLTSVGLLDSNNEALRANKLIAGVPYSAYFNGNNFQLIELGAAVDGSNITSDFSVNIFRSKISNVILAYRDSGITYNNNIFTVKTGFQVLIPNGKTDNNNLNSSEIYVSQDSSYNAPTNDGTYYLFMKSDKSLIWTNTYSESSSQQAIDSSKIEAYYNITQNKMYYHISNSNSWVEQLMVYLGTFTVSSSVISALTLRNPIRLDNFSNVSLIGNQTISGTKTFTSNPLVPTPSSDDNSQKTATTAFVKTVVSITLNAIYPVGSTYITTQNTGYCPIASLIPNSQWELVGKDHALWTTDGTNANTTIPAGLPNITGAFTGLSAALSAFEGGCFYNGNNLYGGEVYPGGANNNIGFDASRSSSIYGASSTVQPQAYRVNVWRRTA